MPHIKFPTHPKDAELKKLRPMHIEVYDSGLKTYKHLTDHPIYYYNALQYLGGSIYRASLGYETLWDRKAENKIVVCLDYYLTDLREKGSYYLEEVKVKRQTRVHGVVWPRGIAPQTFAFDLQWPFELQKNESLTARVNLLDKPNHVDLERSNGDVFTIPYMKYERMHQTGTVKRKPNYVKPTALTNRTTTPKSQARSLSLVGGYQKRKPDTREIPQKLYPMPSGYRRLS